MLHVLELKRKNLGHAKSSNGHRRSSRHQAEGLGLRLRQSLSLSFTLSVPQQTGFSELLTPFSIAASVIYLNFLKLAAFPYSPNHHLTRGIWTACLCNKLYINKRFKLFLPFKQLEYSGKSACADHMRKDSCDCVRKEQSGSLWKNKNKCDNERTN